MRRSHVRGAARLHDRPSARYARCDLVRALSEVEFQIPRIISQVLMVLEDNLERLRLGGVVFDLAKAKSSVVALEAVRDVLIFDVLQLQAGRFLCEIPSSLTLPYNPNPNP